MTQADKIADALRLIAPEKKLFQEEIPVINQLGKMWEDRMPKASVTPPQAPTPDAREPRWITEAKKKIGQKEIVGPRNNSWIANGWATLGAPWFNSDETPWCGFFVADCLHAAGLPYPGRGSFARALNWVKWGTETTPRVGAIGVKTRDGGGHVFFIVGITKDGAYYKALGGNQGNEVNIKDIPVSSVRAVRWPQGAPVVNIPLPRVTARTISSNES